MSLYATIEVCALLLIRMFYAINNQIKNSKLVLSFARSSSRDTFIFSDSIFRDVLYVTPISGNNAIHDGDIVSLSARIKGKLLFASIVSENRLLVNREECSVWEQYIVRKTESGDFNIYDRFNCIVNCFPVNFEISESFVREKRISTLNDLFLSELESAGWNSNFCIETQSNENVSFVQNICFSHELSKYSRHRLKVKLRYNNERRKASITLILPSLVLNGDIDRQSPRFRVFLREIIPFLLNYLIPFIVLESNHKKSYDINYSDGYEGEFRMDSFTKDSNSTIPDLYALQGRNRAYANPKGFLEFYREWLTKRNAVFWRGSTTGHHGQTLESCKESVRYKVCKAHRFTPNMDIKFTSLCQFKRSEMLNVENHFNELSILGPRVDESVFSEYRMFPDLPGNARAWGTIFRYLDGCLIFRPVNQSRYLKYDDYIKPWLHFIPVNEDFSDLAQKAEFAIQNTMQSAYIAWNGYLAARRYLINIEAAFPEDSFYNIGLLIPQPFISDESGTEVNWLQDSYKKFVNN